MAGARGVQFLVAATLALALIVSPPARGQDATHPPSPLLSPEALAHREPTLRALVVVRGECVALDYARKDIGRGARLPVYSVTKSVLALLVGIAIERGAIRLDETLGEIFPGGFGPDADRRARGVAIRDLLTMTGGFTPSASPNGRSDAPPPRAFRRLLARPMAAAPGERFAYDGAGANLLSAALSRALSGRADRFARRTLFAPLGIGAYAWDSDPEGRLGGESDLQLSVRDMAKIGVLVRDRGRWRGRPIVPEGFLRAATARQSEGGPPYRAAYGYLWWVREEDGAAFAAGSGDQAIYVAPPLGVVVALAAEGLPDGAEAFARAVAAEAAALPRTECGDRIDR